MSIIDESRHRPGTLFLAANRYQVDDRQPYVFRTHDYGKTWTKITNGIADGHFARAVREDPVRLGLLFLATEHGVYFSMDEGALWQSLQLNLPDTPVRDLVVKDNDVVLGTHGRGFWILDDIQPLRQHRSEFASQPAVLYEPGDAFRGLTDASFQYYLQGQLDTITFEILDARQQVVRTFTGSLPEYQEDPNVPSWERDGSGKPTTARGLNRFTWDLRYPGATVFPGMIIWSGRPQRGPKAPPGTYQVRMKAGGVEQTHPFRIVMDPNLKGVTESELQEQFELASRIVQRTSAANEAVIRIREIRGQIDSARSKVPADGYESTLKPFLGKLAAIEEELYQVRNQSGQDPLNFPIRLNNRLASLRRSVETGDARPTAGAYKVFGELSAELDRHLGDLEAALQQHLSGVNEVLTTAGAKPIPNKE